MSRHGDVPCSAIRAGLDRPIVDADAHIVECNFVVDDYVRDFTHMLSTLGIPSLSIRDDELRQRRIQPPRHVRARPRRRRRAGDDAAQRYREHFEKRNVTHLAESLDPAKLDMELFVRLFEEYGDARHTGKRIRENPIRNSDRIPPAQFNEFAASGMEEIGDLKRCSAATSSSAARPTIA